MLEPDTDPDPAPCANILDAADGDVRGREEGAAEENALSGTDPNMLLASLIFALLVVVVEALLMILLLLLFASNRPGPCPCIVALSGAEPNILLASVIAIFVLIADGTLL